MIQLQLLKMDYSVTDSTCLKCPNSPRFNYDVSYSEADGKMVCNPPIKGRLDWLSSVNEMFLRSASCNNITIHLSPLSPGIPSNKITPIRIGWMGSWAVMIL